MIATLIQVAAGGATGAMCRYLLGLGVVHALGREPFPMGVLVANILGSFLMGVLFVTFAHRGLTHLGPLVLTGFLGGFTTFSSFSLETVDLIDRGEFGWAAAYVALSVGVSVLALILGMTLARGVTQ
ncbi:fluoride efflux transporter CrcB [Chachezhania antarctica]|uniref:fluoride efflux transporter CrcB n=1 Tax=Chachezhania antarctica TaxID=2340860 RepID=UPI000EB319F5|nr:fluoride efflux transporter CrcB [Chachezhania antarctica]